MASALPLNAFRCKVTFERADNLSPPLLGGTYVESFPYKPRFSNHD
jgi:hypothetical protein